MRILYIYRNRTLGFSIAKVFKPIENEMRKYAEINSLYLPTAGAKPWHLWKNIRATRRAVTEKTYDIVHITGSEYYLTPFLKGRFKVVVTVHDLGFFTNFSLTPRTFILYLLWIKTLKFADHVTCISEKTMYEVLRVAKLAPSMVSTIHNPVDNIFRYSEHKFDVSYPIVLHIGTKHNKNLNNTIVALKNFPHKLRIIGRLTTEQQTLLDTYHTDYSNVYNLTDEEIVHEYEQCDIVNFPSLYEGFGMPIIEGQAIGRVIVTSDLSPMREIAGDAAILVDPHDCTSILQGYKRAVQEHSSYVKKGLENVKRFCLENIVREYFSTYKKLLL